MQLGIGVLRRQDLLMSFLAFSCGYGASVLSGLWLQGFIACWVILWAWFVWRRIRATKIEHSIRLALMVHLALLAGLLFGEGVSSLWVIDSINLHLPGIKKTMAFYRGEGPLAMDSIFGGQVQITYLWMAPWFLIFGISPAVSAISLLVLRVLTWICSYLLSREIFGERASQVAVLLMALTPTQMFYAMPLYKDPVVQLLTMVCLWSLIRCYRYGHPMYAIASLFTISALMIERFYMAPAMLLSLLLAIVFAPDKKWRLLRLGLLGTGMAAGTFVFWRLFKRDFNLAIIGENLEWVRSGFQGGAEVDREWNMNLSYPLAFAKILFTPFFRLNKFDFFKDLSALLTWGSFWSQAVIALASIGILDGIRKNRMQTLILILPLFFFLIAFAYLAPFSGRQRDSFFPVLSMFAASSLVRLFEKTRIECAG